MAEYQVLRWASENQCPRSGKIFEVPPSYLLSRVGLVMALAGGLWWANNTFMWRYKPESLNPEFVAEAKKIGAVAVRGGPWVELMVLDSGHMVAGGVAACGGSVP